MATTIPMRKRGHNNFRPQKTAMLLAQRIVGEISERDLAPGTPLPPEREMLESYGIARGTLREALRFLEIQGVITIKTGPGGGPIVAEPESRHLASVIAMRLQLTHTHFRAVLEAREVLEPVLARQAAERITDDQLEELRESTERMKLRIEDVEAFLAENEFFHTLIARGSGNEFFSLVIASLNWIVDATPLGVEYPRKTREAVWKEHVHIYEAIAARDAAAAEQAMVSHIGDFARYLRKKYPEVVEAELRWDQVDS
jgi:GntR family transcriptional regulator, transcriptional repressor for pyruvate dehydrogenase complex